MGAVCRFASARLHPQHARSTAYAGVHHLVDVLLLANRFGAAACMHVVTVELGNVRALHAGARLDRHCLAQNHACFHMHRFHDQLHATSPTLQLLHDCRARLAGALAGRLAPLAGGDVPVVDNLPEQLVQALQVELMLPLHLLMFEQAEAGTADIDWLWFLGLELPVVQVGLRGLVCVRWGWGCIVVQLCPASCLLVVAARAWVKPRHVHPSC